MLVLGGEIDAMIEIAGYDVGAAADHGVERLRAALEVDHLDIDAGLLVFAELLAPARSADSTGTRAPPIAMVTFDLRERQRRTSARARPSDASALPHEFHGHEFLPCVFACLCGPVRRGR